MRTLFQVPKRHSARLGKLKFRPVNVANSIKFGRTSHLLIKTGAQSPPFSSPKPRVVSASKTSKWPEIRIQKRFSYLFSTADPFGHPDTHCMQGVPAVSELAFAAEALPPSVPMAAITGTNGKSTVTTFVGQVSLVCSEFTSSSNTCSFVDTASSIL